MGTVQQLAKGLDENIRMVKIKQSNGAEEYHSISNLYLLETTITHLGKDLEVGERQREAQ